MKLLLHGTITHSNLYWHLIRVCKAIILFVATAERVINSFCMRHKNKNLKHLKIKRKKTVALRSNQFKWPFWCEFVCKSALFGAAIVFCHSQCHLLEDLLSYSKSIQVRRGLYMHRRAIRSWCQVRSSHELFLCFCFVVVFVYNDIVEQIH